MAAKTPAKPKPKAAFLEHAVSFGNLSIGVNTATLRVSMERNGESVDKLDKSLCGCRLSGKIVARSGGALADQDPLPGMDAGDEVFDGIFDVKGLSISPNNVSFGLAFALKGLEIEELTHFVSRDGRLIVYESQTIPTESEDDDEDSAFDEE